MDHVVFKSPIDEEVGVTRVPFSSTPVIYTYRWMIKDFGQWPGVAAGIFEIFAWVAFGACVLGFLKNVWYASVPLLVSLLISKMFSCLWMGDARYYKSEEKQKWHTKSNGANYVQFASYMLIAILISKLTIGLQRTMLNFPVDAPLLQFFLPHNHFTDISGTFPAVEIALLLGNLILSILSLDVYHETIQDFNLCLFFTNTAAATLDEISFFLFFIYVSFASNTSNLMFYHKLLSLFPLVVMSSRSIRMCLTIYYEYDVTSEGDVNLKFESELSPGGRLCAVVMHACSLFTSAFLFVLSKRKPAQSIQGFILWAIVERFVFLVVDSEIVRRTRKEKKDIIQT